MHQHAAYTNIPYLLVCVQSCMVSILIKESDSDNLLISNQAILVQVQMFTSSSRFEGKQMERFTKAVSNF